MECPLLLRQIWALLHKDLLILCLRRPVGTLIRAVVVPVVVVVLLVGYGQNLFVNTSYYGVSARRAILTLKDAFAATPKHDVVGFLNNRTDAEDITSVIRTMSEKVLTAGKTPRLYNNFQELRSECASNADGYSPCYASIVFHASLSELSKWRYTIVGSNDTFLRSYVDLQSGDNGLELYLLPLQCALESTIISHNTSVTSSPTITTFYNSSGGLHSPPEVVDEVLFTDQDKKGAFKTMIEAYLDICNNVFAPIFSIAMAGFVHHMASYLAAERETRMTALIDTMLAGGSAVRSGFIRQASTVAAFTVIYTPGWVAVGIVMSSAIFPRTSNGFPIGYNILCGCAFTSFALFWASIFRLKQLSGIISTALTIIFAVLPMAPPGESAILAITTSLLFPSANYTYVIKQLALWDKQQSAKAASMYSLPDDHGPWTLMLYLYLIFLGLQVLLYAGLAFLVEHVFFSSSSPGRRLHASNDANLPAVSVTNLCKTYKPNIFSSSSAHRKPIHAVVDLNLEAFPGQILCMLGPNGGGKSTTLKCIAGQETMTSGRMVIDGSGGLGYAPQSNILWPELTVEEHVRIFSDFKCIAPPKMEDIYKLIESCDLAEKLFSKAETLSGGQKRKLQLAMMFVGGSAVCILDEVTTGLDPISRQRIWEILLAERERRAMIMTTHFLDKADHLADMVAIMHEGRLKAEGTPVALKNEHGNGYTIKLGSTSKPQPGEYLDYVDNNLSQSRLIYRVANASLAVQLSEYLERHHLGDYQVTGPTMEELFARMVENITSSTTHLSTGSLNSDNTRVLSIKGSTCTVYRRDIDRGRPTSNWAQWLSLLSKRLYVLKRRYVPYITAATIFLAGTAASQITIRSFVHLGCPFVQDFINFDDLVSPSQATISDVANNLLVGSSNSSFNFTGLRQTIAGLYNVNVTFHNQAFSDYEQLISRITTQQQNPDTHPTGGIWLDKIPVVLYNVDQPWTALYMQNFLNIALSGIPIAAQYRIFPERPVDTTSKGNVPMFIVYYGLIIAAYPAFFALQPAIERLSHVRIMQYSNGIRPIPLWLSYLALDIAFVTVLSTAGTALLYIAASAWYGKGYIFVVFLLYGIASILISYNLSMVARSAAAAWFYSALISLMFYWGYLGVLLAIRVTTPQESLQYVINASYFGLALISPIVSLHRANEVGLGQWGFLCNDYWGGSIYRYGGPILYLTLQIVALFALLLWQDGTFHFRLDFRPRAPREEPEGTEMLSTDEVQELLHLHSEATDLHVETVSKQFGKVLAVDNATFGVHKGEIFALLGPNGAGKSIIISMIRGDLRPSTKASNISIAGYPILGYANSARSHLGVCPQFDATDALTVLETLRFYAKIRGVQDVEHNVRTVIEDCGLEPYKDHMSEKLSGGTKRKLSLATALVGNPRVLLLDEPSSGLDVNAKRQMWQTLRNVSKGRAVVLTTHSMEEADVLADRIGIVQSRMLASGDREALKKRAGDAFHVHLVARFAPRATNRDLEIIKHWIAETFPDAKITREAARSGQLRFEVPSTGRTQIQIIKALETAKVGLGVENYSVGKATLDEVFENIVRKYGKHRMHVDGEVWDEDEEWDSSTCAG